VIGGISAAIAAGMAKRRVGRGWVLAVAVLAGCGSGGNAGSGGAGGGGSGGSGGGGADASTHCFSSNECPTGWTCTEFGTCIPPAATGDGGVTPPPETEREFGLPQSALRYVYVNLPLADELVRIDGSTLEARSLTVGDRPDVLVTLPGSDDALTLETASATATIVRPRAGATDVRTTVATLPNLNAVDVDPTAHYAVAWFDLSRYLAAGGSDVGNLGSFQDVSVIGVAPGQERSASLAVGFRPRQVVFNTAGDHAYVVTDDGISIVDLAQAAAGNAQVTATVPVVDPLNPPPSLEVLVAPDGRFAAVRETGRALLRIVSLAPADRGQSTTIALPAEPTDIDLTPDGTRVLAMLREAESFAVLEMPAGTTVPGPLTIVPITGQPMGSAVIDHQGHRALLFTNATDLKRIVAVDLSQPSFPFTVWPVRKGIRAIAFSPDGGKALILHTKLPGDPATAQSIDELIDRSYGYSLFDVQSGFAKLVLTPVNPGAFAFAPASPRAYLALDGGDGELAVRQLQVIDLDSFVVDSMDLLSPPQAVGVLPAANVAYVVQRHPRGRITFVDLVTSARRTITGFDLNGTIID
jgi:DNA-binding beta-propeller fold protein YncE